MQKDGDWSYYFFFSITDRETISILKCGQDLLNGGPKKVHFPLWEVGTNSVTKHTYINLYTSV